MTKSSLPRRHSKTSFAQRSVGELQHDEIGFPAQDAVSTVTVDQDTVTQDTALVGRLIDGCEVAWQEFVGRYAGLVRSRVACIAATTGLGRDVSQIEDLVAEVFAALLNNDSAALRAYAGRSSFATYLCVIASRVAIRKSVLRSPTANSVEVSDYVDNRSVNPTELASRGEQTSRLRDMIAELPEKQQKIVSMYHLQGMSYGQISRELGVPIGSVGPTLKRAQEKLRAAMGES